VLHQVATHGPPRYEGVGKSGSVRKSDRQRQGLKVAKFQGFKVAKREQTSSSEIAKIIGVSASYPLDFEKPKPLTSELQPQVSASTVFEL
jgi:hypothetical protein